MDREIVVLIWTCSIFEKQEGSIWKAGIDCETHLLWTYLHCHIRFLLCCLHSFDDSSIVRSHLRPCVLDWSCFAGGFCSCLSDGIDTPELFPELRYHEATALEDFLWCDQKCLLWPESSKSIRSAYPLWSKGGKRMCEHLVRKPRSFWAACTLGSLRDVDFEPSRTCLYDDMGAGRDFSIHVDLYGSFCEFLTASWDQIVGSPIGDPSDWRFDILVVGIPKCQGFVADVL